MSHSTLLQTVLQDHQVLPGYPWMRSEPSEHWEKRKKMMTFVCKGAKSQQGHVSKHARSSSIYSSSHLFCTSQKQARRQEKLAFHCHTLHTVSRQKYGFRINGWFFQLKTRRATDFKSVQMGQWWWHKVLYPSIFPHTDLLPNGKEERGEKVIL